MAGIAQFPGATIETGKITQSDDPRYASVECTLTVYNPARLFWWTARTQFDIDWWAWPFVVFIVIKIAILHRLGRWTWLEDEDEN